MRVNLDSDTRFSSSIEWENTLYNAACYFNERMADAWNKFVDRVVRNGDKEKIAITKKINELQSGLEDLIAKKEAMKEIASKMSADADKAYNEYIKLEPDYNIVRQHHQYEQAVKKNDIETAKKLENVEEEYQRQIKRRADKEKEFQELRKKADDAKNRSATFLRQNNGNTQRFDYEIKNLERMLELHFTNNNDMLIKDKPEVSRLLKSEQCKNAFVIYVKDIIGKKSSMDFYTLITDTERERCIELFYDYMVTNIEYDVYDFIACGYKTEKVNGKTVLKGRYADKTLVFKIFNGFYTSLAGYFQKAYKKVRDEHFRFKSVDDKLPNENENDFDDTGYDKVNMLKNENDPSMEKARKVNKNRLMDISTQSLWMACKRFLLARADKMASSLLTILKNKLPKNHFLFEESNPENFLKGVIEIAVNRIGTELMSGHPIGKKINHIIGDAFGGFDSNPVRDIVIQAFSSLLETYVSFFFVKQIESLYDAREIDRGTLPEPAQNMCDAARVRFEKNYRSLTQISGLAVKIASDEWNSCDEMIAIIEQDIEANDTEKRSDFITDGKEMAVPACNNNIAVRAI